MEKYRLIQEQKPDLDEMTFLSPPSTHHHQHYQQQQHHQQQEQHQSQPQHYHQPHHDDPTSTSFSSLFPEVRITQQGKPRNYISYAMNLLTDGKSDTIVLKAMGRAMNKAVTIAEILKRKVPLHQWNVLSSIELVDVYEPIEEGLDIVTSRRYVSCMTITLSITIIATKAQQASTLSPNVGGTGPTTTKDTLPNASLLVFDTNHSGYQPPLQISSPEEDINNERRGENQEVY